MKSLLLEKAGCGDKMMLKSIKRKSGSSFSNTIATTEINNDDSINAKNKNTDTQILCCSTFFLLFNLYFTKNIPTEIQVFTYKAWPRQQYRNPHTEQGRMTDIN